MKTNHEWTRIDRKTDGPPSTTSGTKLLLQFGALGVTMSWDEGFPGARASRPHQAWHSLGHLPHLDQPGTAPWLSFGLAHAVPAHRVAACSIARKLSAGQRNKYAGGTPALMRWGVSGGRLLRKDAHPLGNSRLPASPAPALPCGSFEKKRPIVNEMKMDHEWTRRDTKTGAPPPTTGDKEQYAGGTPALPGDKEQVCGRDARAPG